MTSYALKPRFQELLRPTLAPLDAIGISANTVTIAATVASVLIGSVAGWLADTRIVFLLLPVWLPIRMALNAIDGMLAREYRQQSKVGAYLNEIGDVISDAAMYAPFAAVSPFGALGLGVVIILSAVTEFAGALGMTIGASRRYDGPMGKSDRAVVFGALAFWISLTTSTPYWAAALIPVMAVLLVVTAVNRARAAIREVAIGAGTVDVNSSITLGPPERRPVEERTFVTHDGVELFYRHWPCTTPLRRGAIVLFHRGHEHSARIAHLADELNVPEFALFAWDARGHGRSPGPRGFSPSFAASVRDVQTFVEHITHIYDIPPEDIAVVAQSVGAVFVATWAHDYAPNIRCMVLASPAFHVKLYVPFARLALKIAYRLRGNFFVNSYVKSRFLTHDRARIQSSDTDPLITRPIAVNMLLALHDAAERVVADARAIVVPTQLLISGADFVVYQEPQHRFFEGLGAAVKERHLLPGFYHDTLGEANRSIALESARNFIVARFDEPWSRASLANADRVGYTRDEVDALESPLPSLSWRKFRWNATRAGMLIGGVFSKGIRLGHQTGFDSGSSLDYVYRNSPTGLGPVGRLVDRNYLQSIGWRGIRQRKVHLEEVLQASIESVAERGMPVRVLDVAAGHGRYVLDAIEQSTVKPESVLLRDYSDINVGAGRELIRARGLDTVVRFESGNAFDASSIASVTPRPTIGIVSGLYELFSDNLMVSHSLTALASMIPPGGLLIYTGQPWHPQLELIARVLTSHRGGKPWIMRRRTQAELDELIARAGFRKVEQRIDEWGIFTVSVAERVAT